MSRAHPERDSRCPVSGCGASHAPDRDMCPTCWGRLPSYLRAELGRARWQRHDAPPERRGQALENYRDVLGRAVALLEEAA